MNYIYLRDYGEGALALHFIIKGEPGEAYPPLFALNSEHTVVLTFDGEWYKVAYHYFPGSEGKFENDLDVEVITKVQMLAQLYAEFAKVSPEVPEVLYDRAYARGNPRNIPQPALPLLCGDEATGSFPRRKF